MANCAIQLYPEDSRLTTYPIFRKGLYQWYQDATKSYWTPSEIDLSTDRACYETLTPDEQHFIKYVLAFFAASDGLVNMNLAARFKADFPILEVQYFYDFQMAMENIHAEMYSLLLDTIISSREEKHMLLNSIETIPVIKKISQWILQTMESSERPGARLLRMVIIEGLLFSGCFCAIYWLQSRGLMAGLAASNELISKDETLHTMFALSLYDNLKPEEKLSSAEVHKIFRAGINLAEEFTAAAIPNNLIEINSQTMSNYLKCQADNLLTLLGVEVLYKAQNTLHYMQLLNLKNRTNFFERRVTEYNKPNTSDSTPFETVEDF